VVEVDAELAAVAKQDPVSRRLGLLEEAPQAKSALTPAAKKVRA
jgi:hypothetical protein